MVLLVWLFEVPQVADVAIPDSEGSIERGRYLVDAGGCVSCHESSEHPQSLSGGMALESEFGTFYVPNITPDIATGVGSWTGQDFLLALKYGRSPGGGFYFPAFPYLSYAGMTDQDALDIAAFLMSLPAVEFTAPEHEIPAWLQRWELAGWNRLAARSGPRPAEETDPQRARGAYLARHLGHCGECHTPRNSLGVPDFNREFAGARLGDGEVEPIDAQALAAWTQEDFGFFLFLGVKPDGEFVGGEMEQVIEHNTSKLTQTDRQALAAFFKRHPHPREDG
jgi:mono/diheme cytochrome c family protein